MLPSVNFVSFFFFNDTATTEIYTLSLHDALPISKHIKTTSVPATFIPTAWDAKRIARRGPQPSKRVSTMLRAARSVLDRKSTRLNSSHANISYAVFCLKKKKIQSFRRSQRFLNHQ